MIEPIHRLQVVLNGTEYQLRKDKTLLDELLLAGVFLPHSCRSGHCGSCRLLDEQTGLSVLACQVTLEKAMVLDSHWQQSGLPGSLVDLSYPAKSLAFLKITTPAIGTFNTPMLVRSADDFTVGRRMLTTPCEDGSLGFYTTLHPGEPFDRWLKSMTRFPVAVELVPQRKSGVNRQQPAIDQLVHMNFSSTPLLVVGINEGIASVGHWLTLAEESAVNAYPLLVATDQDHAYLPDDQRLTPNQLHVCADTSWEDWLSNLLTSWVLDIRRTDLLFSRCRLIVQGEPIPQNAIRSVALKSGIRPAHQHLLSHTHL